MFCRIFIVCEVTWATCLKPSGVWKRLRYVTGAWHLYWRVVCIFIVDFLSLFHYLAHTFLFLGSHNKGHRCPFSPLKFLKQFESFPFNPLGQVKGGKQ